MEESATQWPVATALARDARGRWYTSRQRAFARGEHAGVSALKATAAASIARFTPFQALVHQHRQVGCDWRAGTSDHRARCLGDRQHAISQAKGTRSRRRTCDSSFIDTRSVTNRLCGQFTRFQSQALSLRPPRQPPQPQHRNRRAVAGPPRHRPIDGPAADRQAHDSGQFPLVG